MDKEYEAAINAFMPENAFLKDEIVDFLKIDVTFAKAFTKEQRITLIAIFERILDIHYYHTDDEETPHTDTIYKKIESAEAKLRNHRHDTTKSFSAKAEF